MPRIVPVSDFRADIKSVSQFTDEGEVVVLTQNGRPKWAMIDYDTWNAAHRLDEPLVEPRGGASRTEHMRDGRCRENPAHVVGHRIANGGVARPSDGAARKDVPEGDVVAKAQVTAFVVGLGHGLLPQRRHHAPEAVLGVAVVEAHLAGLGAGHRPQHKHAAILIKYWLKRVNDALPRMVGRHASRTTRHRERAPQTPRHRPGAPS